MPATENFTILAGDDVQLNFTVEAVEDLSLAGAIVRWYAARSVNVQSALADIQKESPSDGIEITDEEARTFSVSILAADTQNLRGRFYHEAEVETSNGKVYTVTTGVMIITPTLIKPEA